MHFKQFYLGCLSHASYLIGSEGEAVVVDPQRDIDQYLAEAENHNLKIKYVIETHLHADFVSGHAELAARTGAEIVFSKKAEAKLQHLEVKDGNQLKIGSVILEILETPGHTPESISILVTDIASPEIPKKILTGDTLFIGDVGRPDLVGSKGFSSEQMASMLYESLHEKLLKLDDSVEVYPAHGAGSLCGRNISSETYSTIGDQKRFNYALKPMSKNEFVKMMTSNLPEVPQYFQQDVQINAHGAAQLKELPTLVELVPEKVNQLIQQEYTILDVRTASEFGAGHIPGSINIGLNGQFASWSGIVLPLKTPLIITAENIDKAKEAALRLARIGMENIVGFITIESWEKAGFESDMTPQISVDELNALLQTIDAPQVIDVRKPSEYTNGHVPKAVNYQLSELTKHLSKLDSNKPIAVICAGGYRSSIGTSLLAKHGFDDVINITGGTSSWIKAGYSTE